MNKYRFSFRVLVLWLVFAVLAILNGLFREYVLVPWIGYWSMPASGLMLSLMIFGVCILVATWFKAVNYSGLVWVGVIWVCLTLLFEVLFGIGLQNADWHELLAILDPRTGNLFIVVLLSLLLSPCLALRIQR